MSDDPRSDPFAPPEISTEVCCLHCGETYDSWQIEWRMLTNRDGKEHGFWCCPIAGCDGKGFGFDILPTDPNYQDERGGWFSDDDAEEDDDEGDAAWSEPDEDDLAWSETEGLAESAEQEVLPFEEPPPPTFPPVSDRDFPFSAN